MDPLAHLRARLKAAGSEHKLAAELGVSRSYIGDVLRERTKPGPLLLKALGIKRALAYRRAK